MAQSSWPFENLDTSETQYSYLMRNIGQGPISGRGNELEPYADSSGMNVKVADGEALVRGHYFSSTGPETLSLEVSNPSLPRIDRLVLRLDPTANSILFAVKTGTPNASPAAPALVQTDTGVYEIAIANIAVGAGVTTISAGNLTDQRALFSPWTGSVALASVTGLQTALDAKQDVVAAVSTKSGAYTLAVTDTNDFIQANGTFTITVPASTFAAGARVDIANIGTGTITFAGSGLTLSSKDSKVTVNKQFAAATLFFTSATTALLVGDLA